MPLDLDFSLSKYERLCKTIVESKYSSVTLAKYLQLGANIDQPFIITRHDIDRTPQRALDVAEVEYKYNIQATYYFRKKKGTYVPRIMDKISSLGHEIGYHYETIDKCRGNMGMAKDLFTKELADFRQRYDVKTVCAHGNPLTKYDNKKIWDDLKFADFGLLGEAFLSLDYSKFAYFSDSGRTWSNSKSQKMPGKDCVQTVFDRVQPKSTNDVINIIQEGTLPNICILSHSERWNKDIVSYCGRYFLDLGFSFGKIIIFKFRNNSGNN